MPDESPECIEHSAENSSRLESETISAGHTYADTIGAGTAPRCSIDGNRVEPATPPQLSGQGGVGFDVPAALGAIEPIECKLKSTAVTVSA